MKINILDGGMIFEINKVYSDYGQYAIKNDKNLINNIYKSYIDLGCKFITTCNYCFTPLKLKNWKNLSEESILIIDKFKKMDIKILGRLPPYFKSYHYEKINLEFENFYKELVQIFSNKVDFYLIETAVDFSHVSKICEIIRTFDKKTNIIVSIYINESNAKNIDKYFTLPIYGLFFNCCTLHDIINFYETNLKNKNFRNIKFGFSCNKINEKQYSEQSNVSILQNFKNNDNISKDLLNNFLNSLEFDEVFIGGCCGYGPKEMEELIEMIN